MSYRPKYDNGNDLPIDAETVKGRVLNTTGIHNTGDSSADDALNDKEIATNKVIKDYIDAIRNVLLYTSNLNNSSNTFIQSNGSGLTKDGNALKHTNEITAGTIGSSSETSGRTIEIPYVNYDANGHITSGGTKTHTVTGSSLQYLTISDISTYSDVELYTLISTGHSFTANINAWQPVFIKGLFDETTSKYVYKFYIIGEGSLEQLTSGSITIYYRD